MRSTERNSSSDPGVLGRVVTVLDAFDNDHPERTLAELSRSTGLPKSTVHRLATAMCQERLLERDPAGLFRLGGRLFELGGLVARHRGLREVAQPIMEDLWESTKRRIHLAALDGVDVVYLAIMGGSSLGVGTTIGSRIPAHATGVGKVVLAYSGTAVVQARLDAGLPASTPRTITTPELLTTELRKIRSVGMALDIEESVLGVSCVAAPVFGADRRIVAGLSITGPTATLDPGTLGPAVRTAAFTISRILRTGG